MHLRMLVRKIRTNPILMIDSRGVRDENYTKLHEVELKQRVMMIGGNFYWPDNEEMAGDLKIESTAPMTDGRTNYQSKIGAPHREI